MSLKNRFCNVEIAFISRVSIAVLRHNVRNFHGERLSNSISSHSVFLMRHNIQNWYSKWPLKFDFPIPMRLKFRFFHRQYFIWMFRFLNVFVNSLSRTDLQRHSWKLVLSSSFRNIAPSSNRFERCENTWYGQLSDHAIFYQALSVAGMLCGNKAKRK